MINTSLTEETQTVMPAYPGALEPMTDHGKKEKSLGKLDI
jgi:hypothetical protein